MRKPFSTKGRAPLGLCFVTRMVAVCALALLTPRLLLAEDDAIKAAKEALTNLMKSGEMLKACPQYEGLIASACVQSDKPGDGLGCPSTRVSPGGTPERCTAQIFKQVMAGITNTNLRARIEASSLHTAMIDAQIELRESATHIHSNKSELASTCPLPNNPTTYIKRKDFVKFRFALYDAAKVSLSITTTNFGDFEAQVKDSEGFTYSFEALICGREAHQGECGR